MLRQLASFRVNQTILLNFYRGIIESILTSSVAVWFGRITNEDLEKLNSIVRTCEHIIGTELLPLEYICYQRLERKTKLIMKAGLPFLALWGPKSSNLALSNNAWPFWPFRGPLAVIALFWPFFWPFDGLNPKYEPFCVTLFEKFEKKSFCFQIRE